MPLEKQGEFQNYIEKVKGDDETKIEILEDIKLELKEKPELRKKIEKTKARILERKQNANILRPNLRLPDERK